MKHNLPDPFTTDATRKTLVESNRPSIFSIAGAWRPSQNTHATTAAPRPSPSSSLQLLSKEDATHTVAVSSSRTPYLPTIQWSLPVAYMYPYSRYREYLRERLNVRLHIDPILEASTIRISGFQIIQLYPSLYNWLTISLSDLPS